MELIAENGTRLLINGNTIEIFGDIYIKAEAQAVFYDKDSNFDYAITKMFKIYSYYKHGKLEGFLLEELWDRL